MVILKLRVFNSLVINTADLFSVPAGGALAVDRSKFSKSLTQRLSTHPLIEIKRIEQLEYYTSLSFLEKEAKDQPIFTDAGIERFKNGILVDQFSYTIEISRMFQFVSIFNA